MYSQQGRAEGRNQLAPWVSEAWGSPLYCLIWAICFPRIFKRAMIAMIGNSSSWFGRLNQQAALLVERPPERALIGISTSGTVTNCCRQTAKIKGIVHQDFNGCQPLTTHMSSSLFTPLFSVMVPLDTILLVTTCSSGNFWGKQLFPFSISCFLSWRSPDHSEGLSVCDLASMDEVHVVFRSHEVDDSPGVILVRKCCLKVWTPTATRTRSTHKTPKKWILWYVLPRLC